MRHRHTEITPKRAVKATVLGLAGALSLGACSLDGDKPQVSGPPPMSPVVRATLEQSSARAAEAVYLLARTEQAKAPPSFEADVPDILRQPMSIDWTGPLDSLVKSVADRFGWRFDEVGLKPSNVITVVITPEQQSVYHVLQSAGLQAGKAADIVFKQNPTSIELRYEKRNVAAGR